MNFKKFDPNQDLLLPPSLQELIPSGDLVYFIKEVVSYMDMKPFYKRYSNLGQNAYHPLMLLSIIFYAATQGIFSSRKIADKLTESVRFMYLAGRKTPDFRTISDFRKNNLDLIRECFAFIVVLGKMTGVATLREISIDGSKFAASASSHQNKDRAQIAELLAEVEAEIAPILEKAQLVDKKEDAEDSALNPALAELKNLQKYKNELLKAKEILDRDAKREKVNLTDPECRQQKKIGPGYNGQIAVDAKNQFIVLSDVTSEPNDRNSLVRLVEGLEETTQSQGTPKKIEADSGFASAKAYRELNENYPHIDLYVPTQEQIKRRGKPVDWFDSSNFKYDLQNKTAQCPIGCKMRYLRSGTNKSGEAYVNFIGAACAGCPVKFLCTEADFRNLVVLKSHPLIEKMEKKMDSAAGKRAMRIRKQTVELVFGIFKEQMGRRRFQMRGLEKVKGEFTIMCIGYDLNKLHKLVTITGLTEVLAAISAKIDYFFAAFFKTPAFSHVI
jgi:transposase